MPALTNTEMAPACINDALSGSGIDSISTKNGDLLPGPVPTSVGQMPEDEQAATAPRGLRIGRLQDDAGHSAAELDITSAIRGKTFLVTGVTGFMGTVLVRHLCLTSCLSCCGAH